MQRLLFVGAVILGGGCGRTPPAFDEDHPSLTERSRMTFAKLDDTHYKHRAEVDTGRGYQLLFEKTCRKA